MRLGRGGYKGETGKRVEIERKGVRVRVGRGVRDVNWQINR